jgi:Cytochrome c7 and related cytochrome c
MAQVFHPSTNTLSKVSFFGALFFVAAAAWVGAAIQRSPWSTDAQVAREQPVPFSHRHHVGQLGIDCRYCHTSVEQSAFAGMPATKVCMTCHSQLYTDAPMLEPVRESFRTDLPIAWTRVHDLPDFAYFNHSIHVAKGIGCESCHGRVDDMPLTWREHSLQMEWCLACHREPERFIRPRDEIFQMGWDPRESAAPTTQEELGARLVELYGVNKKIITDCSTCHR